MADWNIKVENISEKGRIKIEENFQPFIQLAKFDYKNFKFFWSWKLYIYIYIYTYIHTYIYKIYISYIYIYFIFLFLFFWKIEY